MTILDKFLTILENFWTILTIETIFDKWTVLETRHLRHWVKFWQLRTWIHDNLCCSQFVRCFYWQLSHLSQLTDMQEEFLQRFNQPKKCSNILNSRSRKWSRWDFTKYCSKDDEQAWLGHLNQYDLQNKCVFWSQSRPSSKSWTGKSFDSDYNQVSRSLLFKHKRTRHEWP